MIDAKMIGDGTKKLRELAQRVIRTGTVRCRIAPTIVLEQLSRMKGRPVLKDITRGAERELREKAAPRVGKAIVRAGDDRSQLETLVAKAFRYWAYRYIELLWKEVNQRGTWGTVKLSTLRVKERPPQRKGDRGGVGKNINASSWGVRHRPPWYQVQKGKKKAGKARPQLAEGAPPIRISIGGKEISGSSE